MKLHEITVAGDEIFDPESRAWVGRDSPRGAQLDQLLQLYRFHRLRRAANYSAGGGTRGHKRAGSGPNGGGGKRR